MSPERSMPSLSVHILQNDSSASFEGSETESIEMNTRPQSVMADCYDMRGEHDKRDELWQAGRYHELRQHLQSDLIQAEADGDQAQLRIITNNLACVYRMLGDSESAHQFQWQAAQRECDLEPAGELSSVTLSNLACDALLAEDWPLAEGLFWKSLLSELASGDHAAAGSDYANLGLLAGLQGDHEGCRWRLWQAYKLHRKASDRSGQALDLWHLGQSFELTGNWTLCRKLFQKAEQMFANLQHQALRVEAQTRKELAAVRERVVTFDVTRN